MGDPNHRAPAQTPEQQLAARKAEHLRRKAFEAKEATRVKTKKTQAIENNVAVKDARMAAQNERCAACGHFGHNEKSGCFRTNEAALKAFIARNPALKNTWAKIVDEHKNKEAARVRAPERQKRAKAAQAARAVREEKRNSTCIKCNHPGHSNDECFRTDKAARENYLKERPGGRALWERRVREHEWREAHHAAPEKYWKWK